MTENGQQRVVVTGIGTVAPSGIGRHAFWRRSLAGDCFIRPITRFDASLCCSHLAGEVAEFDAASFLPPKVIKQTDRSTHMGIAAALLAAEDARLELDQEDSEQVGMFFANVFGGMEFAERELYAQTFLGPERVSAYQAIAWFYAATQGQLSIRTGIQGYGKTLVADRAGGLQALGGAYYAIQRGRCTLAFAGGFEAPLAPYVFLIHQSSGLLSKCRDPQRAYIPFDRRRSGLVLAEGAGILVLEQLRHALLRGAPIYAEVCGYAVSCDAALGCESGESGQLARCIREALVRGGLCPDDIDYVSADGLGTEIGDTSEATAIADVFQNCGPRPRISVPRTRFGHTLAAAGSLDAAWTALSIKHAIVCSTMNLQEPDSHITLNHVRGSPEAMDVHAAICVSRGYGGLNTALALRSYEAQEKGLQ